MKIEEIRELIKDEDAGKLRKPATIANKNRKLISSASDALTIIVKFILENSDRDVFVNTSYGKLVMKKAGILDLYCEEPRYRIYQTSTIFGKGKFFDSRALFENWKYPKWIVPGFCYSNAYAHILTQGIKAKIVSGIVYIGRGKPFLHSVILTNEGMVIDFNYSLVMDKELYFNLFNFEVLAELESEKILENKEFCLSNPKIFSDYKSYEINFAFDDVIERVKAKQNILDKEVGI